MKRILFAIILIGLCASCQKDFENAQEATRGGFVSKLKVSATIAASKVSFVEDGETHALKASWEVGDRIIGFDSEGQTYGYAISEINDGRATLELITEGDYTGTATADPVDGTAMYMFYAPGASMADIDATKKELSVSIKEQSADVIPALMKAQAAVEDGSVNLQFTNEMAIIAIKTPTMASADGNYSDISIFGTDVNTEMKFSLDTEGNLIATPQTPGRINKAINLESDAEGKTSDIIYIVSAPISNPVKLTFLANNGEHFVKEGKTLEKGNYYYMSPTFSPKPANTLSGGFSVKDKDGVISVVFFSKGNLYSNTTKNTWDFEANQYDYRTYARKRGSIDGSYSSTKTPTSNYGLFGWSTTAKSNSGGRHTKTSATDGYTDGTFKDWGGFIDDTDTWSTLTREQWKWVIGPKDVEVHNKEARECSTLNGVSNARFMLCTVNKVKGVMIFPDVFTWPIEKLPLPEASQINNHQGLYAASVYNDTNLFKNLEDAGVVFLPGAGLRRGSSLDTSYDDSGVYWSATQNDTATVFNKTKNIREHVDNKVFAVYFKDGYGVGEGSFDRWDGAFVRLVSIVK